MTRRATARQADMRKPKKPRRRANPEITCDERGAKIVMWTMESLGIATTGIEACADGSFLIRAAAKPAKVDTKTVYFVQCRDRVKIGVAKDPNKRIRQLSTACPYPIEVIHVMPGGAAHEHVLHRRFSDQRRQGEWFEINNDIVDYLEIVRGWR